MLRAQGNVQYWRLPEGLPSTDPFNGMYLANYGAHGPELLRLYREVVDDEELVIAKKLTGAAFELHGSRLLAVCEPPRASRLATPVTCLHWHCIERYYYLRE